MDPQDEPWNQPQPEQSDEHIFELELDLLQANPLQPRGLITPESLAELAESIREHGILEPIVVAKTPAGYQIIAGERRWRAWRQCDDRAARVSHRPVVRAPVARARSARNTAGTAARYPR